MTASAPASIPHSCGLIAEYSAPPLFSRALTPSFRLRYAARVRLELQAHGGRVVARSPERLVAGDRSPHTLRLASLARLAPAATGCA